MQMDEDGPTRFVQLIRSALSCGLAHVVDSKSGERPDIPQQWGWQRDAVGALVAKGKKIGWVDDLEVYLEPTQAFVVAQSLAKDEGNYLTLSRHTLQKRLIESGMARRGVGKNTVKVTVENCRRNVIAIPKEIIGSAEWK
jgi:hypothetical protein